MTFLFHPGSITASKAFYHSTEQVSSVLPTSTTNKNKPIICKTPVLSQHLSISYVETGSQKCNIQTAEHVCILIDCQDESLLLNKDNLLHFKMSSFNGCFKDIVPYSCQNDPMAKLLVVCFFWCLSMVSMDANLTALFEVHFFIFA